MKQHGEKPPVSNAANRPISMVVVDDHRVMRELISAMLARQEVRSQAAAEKREAPTAIEVFEGFAPDLLIVDIDLPDQSDVGAVTHIREHAPKFRLLLCPAFVTDGRVVEALGVGVTGLWRRPAPARTSSKRSSASAAASICSARRAVQPTRYRLSRLARARKRS